MRARSDVMCVFLLFQESAHSLFYVRAYQKDLEERKKLFLSLSLLLSIVGINF